MVTICQVVNSAAKLEIKMHTISRISVHDISKRFTKRELKRGINTLQETSQTKITFFTNYFKGFYNVCDQNITIKSHEEGKIRKEQFQACNIYPLPFNLIHSCLIQTYIHQNTTKLVSALKHDDSGGKTYTTLCFRHDAINSLFADAGHCGLWSINLKTNFYHNHTTKDKKEFCISFALSYNRFQNS